MQPNDRHITHLTLDPVPRRLGILLDVMDRATNNLTPNRILNLTIDTKVITPQPAPTHAVHRRLSMLLDVMHRATNNVTSNRILKLTIDTKVVTPQPPRTDAVFALCSGRS